MSAPVLVTGATGFIGARLVSRLRADGQQVRALVLPGDPVPAEWDSDVEVIPGDIAEPADVRRAITGAERVFHLAAVVGDWGPETLFRRVTVEGTRHLLAIAGEHDAQVILASSIVVYGDRLGRQRCDEEAPHGKPYGPYSRAKQMQEVLAHEQIDRGADIRIVRPANVYGAGSRNWVDEVIRVLASGAPTLVDGGVQDAGLVHVENVVDVMLRAASERAAAGMVFNACDELGVSWKQYFSDLATASGASRPGSVPGWLAWPLATVMERIWRMVGSRSRPALTREAIHLISSNHRVPATRAREQLGHKRLLDYDAAMDEIAGYLQQARCGEQR